MFSIRSSRRNGKKSPAYRARVEHFAASRDRFTERALWISHAFTVEAGTALAPGGGVRLVRSAAELQDRAEVRPIDQREDESSEGIEWR